MKIKIERQARRRFLEKLGFSGLAALSTILTGQCRPAFPPPQPTAVQVPEIVISLPPPDRGGGQSLAHTLQKRRSVRDFTGEDVAEAVVSQLLWAAQGITDPSGKRTAPSAGALYPLEIHLARKNGLYHYRVKDHGLVLRIEKDVRVDLYEAALRQTAVRDAPLVFIISAVFSRTESRYGAERTPRYVYMEVGHAAQNLLLQAVALDLGGVPIAAFEDERIKKLLELPQTMIPLYLIPVGRQRL